MAFVIVTAPNPPGSKQLISPPAAVFEIAPAKVLHGAVRLHGWTSSPTPDTHVRVACACTSEAKNTKTANTAKALKVNLISFISSSLRRFCEQRTYRRGKFALNGQTAPPSGADKCRGLDSCGYLENQESILRKIFSLRN